jgi:biopolymer transport protein ExbD
MSGHGKKKKKQPMEVEAVNLGFQIAPMINVVFVIMLFFKVMAGAVKVENELKQQLPGMNVVTQDAPEMPDEITVGVEETGNITLNEEELDPPDSKIMPNFIATMMRLKQEADGRNAKVLVTIQAEEQAKYERVIDVLNALARAQISNVTFTVGGEE